jgi:hypothetical protein
MEVLEEDLIGSNSKVGQFRHLQNTVAALDSIRYDFMVLEADSAVTFYKVVKGEPDRITELQQKMLVVCSCITKRSLSSMDL